MALIISLALIIAVAIVTAGIVCTKRYIVLSVHSNM